MVIQFYFILSNFLHVNTFDLLPYLYPNTTPEEKEKYTYCYYKQREIYMVSHSRRSAQYKYM